MVVDAEQGRRIRGRIPPSQAGRRLDQALAALLPEYSRAQLQRWIRAGRVRLDAEAARARERLRGGERFEIDVPPPPQRRWVAQPLRVDVVYEDEALLVVDKPAGLIVHPGAGHPDGTLLNALLHLDPRLAHLPRAGIVHRLDKGTSGLLVVARTERVQRRLAAQLKARRLRREYIAVVRGRMIAGGRVDVPLGRDPHQRTRMAVSARGRAAVTHYRVAARYRGHTLVAVRLQTGRTHQIRVHLAHCGHPIVGDPVYGGRSALPAGASDRLVEVLRGFRRQALHAARLALEHPQTGAPCQWSRPVPADMRALIEALEEDARAFEPERGRR